MKMKKVLLGASFLALTLSIASCKNNKKDTEVRNDITPYGDLVLDSTVATALNNKYSINMKTYYNQLKYNGYSLVTSKIDEAFYNDEFVALKAVYNTDSLTGITNENIIKTLKVTRTKDNATEELYTLDADKYESIRQDLYEQINSTIARDLFGSSDYISVEKVVKNTKDYNDKMQQFIDNKSLEGITITKSDIEGSFKYPEQAGYFNPATSKVISFDKSFLDKFPATINSVILSEAKKLKCSKEIFAIADDEYITEKNDDGEDVTKKNSNYLFKDTAIETTYNNTYKTYGTYQAIIIQFNSGKEANDAINKLGYDIASDPEKAYLDLYKDYYDYKISDPSSITADSDIFTYEVAIGKNDLSDISNSISSLIKDTLEDGQYLSEARNINNKYVLAYRVNAVYDYHDAQGKQIDYKDLDDTAKAEVTAKIKENLVKANSAAYATTLFNKMLKDSELKIWDPYFEYKFEYNYTNKYSHIEEKANATDENIFTMGDFKYTVADFYKDATSKYGSTILSDYFSLTYVNEYYDEYVKEKLISEDLHKDNLSALEKAIKEFNSNKNSTYPSYIGESNYLLGAYGFDNKDDVMKYYYDAKQALSKYKDKNLFDEWAEEKEIDGETKYVISESVTEEGSILNNLLATGNKNYSKLFNINLDHFLINIDDDADGSPDDPAEFLAKNPSIKVEFENAVVELAQALYKEAIYKDEVTHKDYSSNTLYNTLAYIKTQYEEGKPLLSNPGKTWDDYKKFNFLLTVEQLASSGDINQTSVNNFVVPFKEYVEGIYATASKAKITKEYDNGIFYIYNPTTKEGQTISETTDVDMITIDTLCATSFGYHMLVLNSYDGPNTTKFTKSDDNTGFQENIQVVIRKYKDDNDKDVKVYINTDSYNDLTDQANLKQLFIYYVQKQNNDTSSLDSDIQSIMASLFNDVISTYTSTNFQGYLVLNTLQIKVNTTLAEKYSISQSIIDAKMVYYKNNITNYDSESFYNDWFTTLTWVRPDVITNNN